MEFLVKNRVFEDFKIEFLPKIEFFDFWPNRVFVKSHKKKPVKWIVRKVTYRKQKGNMSLYQAVLLF